MPEILTESFCERCGTRYTFESSQPRTARLKGFKVMSRGLKNFVLSDDASLDEAMAAARSDTDREVTAHQLDAFHKTFNFCMSCRQYTCSNCWNEAEGRCLSCAPNLGQEILPSPFPDLPANGNGVGLGDDGLVATNGHTTAGGAGEAFSDADLAWPTSDLMRDADVAADPETETLDDLEPIDAAARLAFLGAIPADETTAGAAGPATDGLANDRADDAEAAEAGAAAGEEQSPTASEAIAEDTTDQPPPDRAAIAAAQTAALLRRFRPGQNLDDEIAAYERSQPQNGASAQEPEPVSEPERNLGLAAAAAGLAALTDADTVAVAATGAPGPEHVLAEPEPERVVAAEPEPAPPVAEPEPEQIAAAEPEPEPVAAAEPKPEPVAAAEPQPEPVAAAGPEVRTDVVEQPVWRVVAPDPEAVPPVAPLDQPAAPASATSEPEWPATPQWPTQRPASAGLPFLDRPAIPTGGIEALWAESAREVTRPTAALGQPDARPAAGVQPCVSCGLSLSSTARFCRRCGSPQA